MSAAGERVVVQLVVDAKQAVEGTASFDAAMKRSQETVTSHTKLISQWQQSLAKTDPVLSAVQRQQQAVQQQWDLGTRAVAQHIISQRDLEAQIGRVHDKYQVYVNQAREAERATTLLGKASGFLSSQMGALAGLVAVGSIAGLAKSIFDTAAALGEQAEQAGVSVEAFQAYRAVMLTSGIANDQAAQIMTRLTRSIGEAEAGGGKARDAFVKLGIGIDTLKGGAESTLPQIARGLLDIADGSERAKLEVDLFGKTGQRLESALKSLISPTSTLIEKQIALRQVMGKELTEAADSAADRLTEAWNRVKVGTAPGISWLVEKLAYLVELNEKVETSLGRRATSQSASAGAGGIASLEGGLLINGKPNGYSTETLDGVLSKLREEASLTGKTAADRARIVALREAEAAKIKDGNGPLTDQERLEVSRLAVVSANYDIAKKAEEARAKAAKQQWEDEAKFEGLVAKFAGEYEAESKKISDAVKRRKQDQDDYVQDLRDEVKLAGMGREEAERYAAVLRGARQYHIEIGSEQSKEIERAIALRQETEKYRELVDGIGGSFQDFFTNVLDTGKAKFGDLWDAINHQFNSMLASMAAQALINPIIIPMVEGIYGLAPGSIGGGGGAMGALGNLGSLSSVFGGSGGGLTNMLGLGGGGGGWFNSLGGSLGFSSQTAIGLNAEGGLSFAQMPGSLFGSTSLGGFLGGAGLGSLASSLIFGNKNSAGIGGMGGAAAGALLGSVFPGVGTIIGGLLGGLAGGGLGSMTGTSNQGAISNFTNGGAGNTLFKAGGGNNGQLATQATSAVNAIVKQLMDAGVSVAMGNISGISIGSDKSYVYGFDGMKEKLGGGDVDAVVKSVLNHILPSASGGDDVTSGILQKYQANGGLNAGNISELVQEIQQAQQAKADAEKASADLKAQVDAFGPAISAALKKITDPAGAAYDDIITAQRARIATAQQLGLDVNQLTALNDAEINQYLHSLNAAQLHGLVAANDITGSIADQAQGIADALDAVMALGQGFSHLSDDIKDLASQANDAGRIAEQTANAWGGAHDALVKSSTALMISAPGLSPTDAYRNGRSQFDSLLSSARAGSAQSANDLASFASTFLQSSFQFNGSTTAYQGDLGYVKNTLASLSDFSGAQQSLAQRQADSAAQAVTVLQDIAKRISSQTDNSAAALAELTSEVGGLRNDIQLVGLFNRLAPVA